MNNIKGIQPCPVTNISPSQEIPRRQQVVRAAIPPSLDQNQTPFHLNFTKLSQMARSCVQGKENCSPNSHERIVEESDEELINEDTNEVDLPSNDAVCLFEMDEDWEVNKKMDMDISEGMGTGQDIGVQRQNCSLNLKDQILDDYNKTYGKNVNSFNLFKM